MKNSIAIFLIIISLAAFFGCSTATESPNSNNNTAQQPSSNETGWQPTSFVVSGGEADRAASQSYWVGEARPFAILDHSCSGSSLSLVIQNSQPYKVTMNEISVDRIGTQEEIIFMAGQRKEIPLISGVRCGPAGSTYNLSISFKYVSSENQAEQEEVGSEPLIGTAS